LILFDSLEVGSSILGFEVLAILDRRGTAALRDPSAAVEDAIFQTKTTKIQILLVVPWYDTYCHIVTTTTTFKTQTHLLPADIVL
jgi:hypothetical protein